ncbi:MAG: hypothetical protein BroJett013_11960 [Alphaproteobacteria bacterium]|nr:MAG: hypothetical protein BroJett013_11960 [Alphaproteobacteria bacterium]
MPSESALAVRAVNTAPGKITLKGEIWRYDATEPTAGMDPRRRIIRAQAKTIIEGRRRFPRELLAWKARRELHYYHGDGALPPWLDERNLTRPQRERALFMDRKHATLVERLRAADSDIMREAARAALREFYAVEAAL